MRSIVKIPTLITRFGLVTMLAACTAWAQDASTALPFGVEGGFVIAKDWHRRCPRGSTGTGSVTTESGCASCVPMAWNGSASRESWPLTLNEKSVTTMIVIRSTDSGFILQTLAVRAATGETLPVYCEVNFVPGVATLKVVETNLGPIFRNAAMCHELAAKGFERHCQSGSCTSVEGRARLFDLGPCELVLDAAKARLKELTNVDEPQKLAMLDQLRDVLRTGGVLFERREMPAQPQCLKWRILPRGPLKAHLTAKWTRDGIRWTEEVDVEAWPLQRRAAWTNYFTTSEALDGSSGGPGNSSSGSLVPLDFGDGRVLLGERWFHFAKVHCERASDRPLFR